MDEFNTRDDGSLDPGAENARRALHGENARSGSDPLPQTGQAQWQEVGLRRSQVRQAGLRGTTADVPGSRGRGEAGDRRRSCQYAGIAQRRDRGCCGTSPPVVPRAVRAWQRQESAFSSSSAGRRAVLITLGAPGSGSFRLDLGFRAWEGECRVFVRHFGYDCKSRFLFCCGCGAGTPVGGVSVWRLPGRIRWHATLFRADRCEWRSQKTAVAASLLGPRVVVGSSMALAPGKFPDMGLHYLPSKIDADIKPYGAVDPAGVEAADQNRQGLPKRGIPSAPRLRSPHPDRRKVDIGNFTYNRLS